MSDLTPTPAEANGNDHPAEDPTVAPLEAAPNGDLGAPEQLESGSDRDGFAAEPPPLETVAATAEEFVAGLLQAAELEAEVASSVTDDSALVEVTGEAMGVLIGRRGQTLDAVQELTRTAVQHRLKARVRVLVDIEGYRARRQASLADYATAMAERAKARGTEIELEPMSAYERKIVHTAVAEVPGASSYSEGEEPQRKVIIRGEET
ncbi:MAG: KH domain-containing protein [Actinomycetota bacterium]|nr:KH domain-containing protein [Actinomycetota bacterium]